MGGLYFICVSVLWISNLKSKILGVQIVGQYLYLRIPDICTITGPNGLSKNIFVYVKGGVLFGCHYTQRESVKNTCPLEIRFVDAFPKVYDNLIV